MRTNFQQDRAMQGPAFTGQIPAARRKLIERIAAQAARKQKRIGKISVPAFANDYYRGVAEDDLRARTIPDLAGAARAHLEFGQVRKRGTALVRVYSPLAKRDGFG